ncbi:hypothetical protein AK812_SmicGene35208 [Symbiodinium microadriaticum]|uniref:Uncharacterized protein n=1 Tax=Symbiodinium microadriaticum TaxID=2951 RepID=A0A1Q9CM16_SYMMI|nr:hypothetical protein AK812_SmicGene35208 [Symbiodinium microadriaticum]
MYIEVCIPEVGVMDAGRYGPDDESLVAVRQPSRRTLTIMVTEARALDDLYQRRSGAAGLDRRAQIRKVLKTQIYWPPRVFMLADSLTKRLGNSQLTRLVMALGLYGLRKATSTVKWTGIASQGRRLFAVTHHPAKIFSFELPHLVRQSCSSSRLRGCKTSI